MAGEGSHGAGDQGGAAGGALLQIGALHGDETRVRAEETQRLRLPARRAVADPRQLGEVGAAAT